MNKNYECFLKTDVAPYIGEWVAICEGKLVSHGKDVKKVFAQAKQKCPTKRPLLTRIPSKETMIF